MGIHYDFIVVGAGSSGCVLANRLTESGNCKVLLLEAGPESSKLTSIPLSFSWLMDNKRVNWRYKSEPEVGTGDRAIPVPRGKVLGGSSSINGLVYVRGQSQDFDGWASLGNAGWGYEDVLPFFKKMENFEGYVDFYRGDKGPLKVSVTDDDRPLYEYLFRAAAQTGWVRNSDYNGSSQEGICEAQATISKGARMSAEHAYLAPIRTRNNLVVVTLAHVSQIKFDGNRCVGVRYFKDGKDCEANADKEVILAAGSINTPQLLELSGVGDENVLTAAGVNLRHKLPGVGENLSDHIMPRLVYSINKKGLTYNDSSNVLGLMGQGMKYILNRKGLLSLPSGPVLAFLKTKKELPSPDIQIHFCPYRIVLKNGKRSLGKESGITCALNQNRPNSRGSVHIVSSDAMTPPRIKFNFLADLADRQALVGGVRLIREFMVSAAMREIGGDELLPGLAAESDDDILDYIRSNADTGYHPVGTCKMGHDRDAVVDENLLVHGIEGLRIGDASIMPTLTSGNTNAPTIMIAEKCSDMVRKKHEI